MRKLWINLIIVDPGLTLVFQPAQGLEREKKCVFDDSKLIIRWMDVVAMKIR